MGIIKSADAYDKVVEKYNGFKQQLNHFIFEVVFTIYIQEKL